MKKRIALFMSIFFVFVFCVMLGITFYLFFGESNKKEPSTSVAADHITGSGTQSDPYLIYTVTGYRTLYQNNTATYNKIYAKLMNDLTITGATNMPLWLTAQGIWWDGDCFPGGLELDGNYKEIQCSATVDVSNTSCPAVAPVPRVDGPSKIKNLKTRGEITIKGSSSFAVHVGGLVGVVSGTNANGYRFPDITIDNCYVATNVNVANSVSTLAGIIGYAVDYSGGFSGGSITVNNTVFCGTMSGSCLNSGKITSTGFSGYNVSINKSNTYISGSIPGQSSDSELGIGFSSAYNTESKFVDGDWSSSKYSSYNYKSNPTLSWLKYRNNAGRYPYSVSYKAVTTTGETLTSGTNGYLIATTKDTDWIYADGYIKLYNFGIQDKTINISSYINGYTFQEATSTSSYLNKTIEIVITFLPPQINIYFNLTSNTNAYYSVDGAEFTQITSYYPQTITDDQKFTLTYSGYSQNGCYSVCEFRFTNYDGKSVVIKYQISNAKYYINGFEYKIKGSGSFVSTNSNVREYSFGSMREFRVGIALKNYNLQIG